MSPRFKIILKSADPDLDAAEAVPALMRIANASQQEAEFWIQNLPHTVTSQASQQNAVRLVETFSKMGFKVESFPMLSEEEIKKGETNLSNSITEVISFFSAKKKSKQGLYLSISIIALITITFCLSLFTVYRLIKKNVQPGKKEVKELIKKGRYSKANEILTQEIQASGKNAEDFLNRAIARILEIRRKGYELNWANHLTSSSWHDNLNKLRNYFNSQEGDAALDDLKKARSLDPDNPDIHKWLGILYQEKRKLEKSESAFSRALSLNPGSVELLNFLGSVSIEQKKYKNAEKFIKAAIRLAPEDPLSLKNFGALHLYHRRDTAKALNYFLKYMKLNTGVDFDRHVIREEITRILWSNYFPVTLNKKYGDKIPFSKFEKQRKSLLKQLSTQRSADVYWELGKLFAKRGMYQEAMLQWLNALKTDPARPEIINDLYIVQGAMNLFSQAKGTLQNALKFKAETPEMHFALGILNKYYVENKEGAIRNFNTYLAFNSIKNRKQATLELKELLGE
ncbi:tetratricopeptide repeat protein [Fibrobacterota bacterium]